MMIFFSKINFYYAHIDSEKIQICLVIAAKVPSPDNFISVHLRFDDPKLGSFSAPASHLSVPAWNFNSGKNVSKEENGNIGRFCEKALQGRTQTKSCRG